MRETWKKVGLYTIYIGIGLILFSPILVDNHLFFPFITTKLFLFRIVVEILLLAFLVLNVVSEEYRPKRNWLLLFLLGFIAAAFISSLLGHNFYLSFWGDMERGEGLNLWLHLLAFFVILTSTVKTRTAWLALLDFSLGSSLLLGLFGLGQALHLKALLATSGSRVDATLGNPAFFATYLLLHIAMALFLILHRESKIARIYYAGVIFFYTFLIFTTQTRGAVVGLAAGIITSAILLAISSEENQKLRRLSAGLILAVVLVTGLLWGFRQSNFVKTSFLARIANVSPESRTAQTRLATWRAALKGIKEKPILGWGFENFEVVFNKNFPPIIYEDEGSQVWFDRAHNVILDRAVSTGIVGIGLFLAFLLYPTYYLLRYVRRLPESDSEMRSAVIIACGFTVAYLIQDLFIFESIAIYMILFFFLAFLSSQYLPQKNLGRLVLPRWAILGCAIVYAVTLGPLVWQINLRPLVVNIAAAAALRSDPEKEDFFVIVDQFKKVLGQGTYGQQEYRLQYIEFVDQQFANSGELYPEALETLKYFDTEAQKQIEEAPENAKGWLLIMRHYNYTFAADSKTRIERLQKALSLYPRLAALSPTRPQVHQEAGYSHLYLYREYKNAGDQEKAMAEYQLAEELFKKTVELNPRVVESYLNLAMLYLNSGEDDKFEKLIALMDEREVGFRSGVYLPRLVSLARSNDRLNWFGFFNEELVKLQPDDPQAWINLAVFYATSGNRAKAIETGERIKQFGGEYVIQAETFIANVKAGNYEKK